MADKKRIGTIEHYFDKISVAVLKVEASVKVGDKISIEGHEPVTQTISSMQINNKPIKEAKKGDAIGLKVSGKVWQKDIVYKVA